MAMTADDVLKLIKDKEVKFVDLRFTDTRGKEQHVSVPVRGACPRTRFRLAEVDRIDTEAQLVHLRTTGSSATVSAWAWLRGR